MKTTLLGFLVLTFLECQPTASQQQTTADNSQRPKDPCDNPDAPLSCNFEHMPASLTHVMTIAKEQEPGERLVISGRVFRPNGKTPYANVVIYAYHTDSKGHYAKNGTEVGAHKWHGYLHGWCKTDSNGNYEIRTIRPAPYPTNTMPAHIHAVIKKEDSEMYWINDFVFKDDPHVNDRYLRSLVETGGTGVVDVQKNKENTWVGKRDIVLR
jgi:protocatechuate 3,4-dioxygenase, beta subunit